MPVSLAEWASTKDRQHLLACNFISPEDGGSATTVSSLDCFFGGVESIAEITAVFTHLTTLKMLINPCITHLDGIGDCPDLQELWVCECLLETLDGIETLKQLQVLHLYDNKLAELSSLASLTNLTVLDISQNQVEDLTPITSLPMLVEVNASRNNIQLLPSALRNLENLSIFDLSGNNISNFSALSALCDLPKLLTIKFKGKDAPPNPICGLKNYFVWVRLLLPHLERLDEYHLSEEKLDAALNSKLEDARLGVMSVRQQLHSATWVWAQDYLKSIYSMRNHFIKDMQVRIIATKAAASSHQASSHDDEYRTYLLEMREQCIESDEYFKGCIADLPSPEALHIWRTHIIDSLLRLSDTGYVSVVPTPIKPFLYSSSTGGLSEPPSPLRTPANRVADQERYQHLFSPFFNTVELKQQHGIGACRVHHLLRVRNAIITAQHKRDVQRFLQQCTKEYIISREGDDPTGPTDANAVAASIAQPSTGTTSSTSGNNGNLMTMAPNAVNAKDKAASSDGDALAKQDSATSLYSAIEGLQVPNSLEFEDVTPEKGRNGKTTTSSAVVYRTSAALLARLEQNLHAMLDSCYQYFLVDFDAVAHAAVAQFLLDEQQSNNNPSSTPTPTSGLIDTIYETSTDEGEDSEVSDQSMVDSQDEGCGDATATGSNLKASHHHNHHSHRRRSHSQPRLGGQKNSRLHFGTEFPKKRKETAAERERKRKGRLKRALETAIDKAIVDACVSPESILLSCTLTSHVHLLGAVREKLWRKYQSDTAWPPSHFARFLVVRAFHPGLIWEIGRKQGMTCLDALRFWKEEFGDQAFEQGLSAHRQQAGPWPFPPAVDTQKSQKRPSNGTSEASSSDTAKTSASLPDLPEASRAEQGPAACTYEVRESDYAWFHPEYVLDVELCERSLRIKPLKKESRPVPRSVHAHWDARKQLGAALKGVLHQDFLHYDAKLSIFKGLVLENCTAINFSGLGLKKAHPLQYLPQLRHLNIGYNNLTSLDWCQKLNHLETLDAYHNRISSVTMKKCPSLVYLDLGANSITRGLALTHLPVVCPLLVILVLNDNPVLEEDIHGPLDKIFASCPALKLVSLQWNVSYRTADMAAAVHDGNLEKAARELLPSASPTTHMMSIKHQHSNTALLKLIQAEAAERQGQAEGAATRHTNGASHAADDAGFTASTATGSRRASLSSSSAAARLGQDAADPFARLFAPESSCHVVESPIFRREQPHVCAVFVEDLSAAVKASATSYTNAEPWTSYRIRPELSVCSCCTDPAYVAHEQEQRASAVERKMRRPSCLPPPQSSSSSTPSSLVGGAGDTAFYPIESAIKAARQSSPGSVAITGIALRGTSHCSKRYIADRAIDFTAEAYAHMAWLQLHECGLQTISFPPKWSTTLTSLSLAGNDLSSIDFVSSLTALLFLDVSHNELQSLEPLKHCKQLHTFVGSFNFISQLRPLEDLASLAVLHLSHNCLANPREVFHLRKLENLRAVSMGSNLFCRKRDVVSFLLYYLDYRLTLVNNERVTQRHIDAARKAFEDILTVDMVVDRMGEEAAFNASKLEFPSLRIRDVRLGKEVDFAYLHTMNLQGNRIVSLEPLSFLRHLKVLNLSENRVRRFLSSQPSVSRSSSKPRVGSGKGAKRRPRNDSLSRGVHRSGSTSSAHASRPQSGARSKSVASRPSGSDTHHQSRRIGSGNSQRRVRSASRPSSYTPGEKDHLQRKALEAPSTRRQAGSPHPLQQQQEKQQEQPHPVQAQVQERAKRATSPLNPQRNKGMQPSGEEGYMSSLAQEKKVWDWKKSQNGQDTSDQDEMWLERGRHSPTTVPDIAVTASTARVNKRPSGDEATGMSISQEGTETFKTAKDVMPSKPEMSMRKRVLSPKGAPPSTAHQVFKDAPPSISAPEEARQSNSNSNSSSNSMSNERKAVKNAARVPHVRFESLEVLLLEGNGINALAPLMLNTFPKLRVLHLQRNDLSTTEGLAGLANLEVLDLGHNRIKTLVNGTLSSCQKLRELQLSGNRLQDLSALTALPELRVLYANHNRIALLESIDIVARQKSLRHFSVLENPLVSKRYARYEMIVEFPQVQWLCNAEVSGAERAQAAALFSQADDAFSAPPLAHHQAGPLVQSGQRSVGWLPDLGSQRTHGGSSNSLSLNTLTFRNDSARGVRPVENNQASQRSRPALSGVLDGQSLKPPPSRYTRPTSPKATTLATAATTATATTTTVTIGSTKPHRQLHKPHARHPTSMNATAALHVMTHQGQPSSHGTTSSNRGRGRARHHAAQKQKQKQKSSTSQQHQRRDGGAARK